MKQVFKIFSGALLLFILLGTQGCKKFMGLERQTDWNFTPHVLDPHINKTAWQFLKERALGDTPADTILKRFYDGIMYAGIDTNEYTKPDRTYIFLHNDAIYRISSNKITTDCYFGYYKTPLNKTGVAWTDYPKEQVKNWLLYLIAKGQYSFENVGPDPVETTTLLPTNTDPKNPESLIYFSVVNDRDSRFRVNDFIGSKRSTQARTAGILATNGPIHVFDRLIEFNQ